MVNPGYKYESETGNSLLLLKERGYKFFYKKLVDTHSYDKASEGKLIIPKTMGDYIILKDARAGFIECKSSRCKTSYNMIDFIALHQIITALEIKRDGNCWYKFHICDRSTRGKHVTYCLDARVVFKLYNGLVKLGNKRSLKWHILAEHSEHILKKMKGSVWDLEYLMEL